jgi:hypothetical protein
MMSFILELATIFKDSTVGYSADTIVNFEVGSDKFAIAGSLNLSQLQISQSANTTFLKFAGTGEVLATLIGGNNLIYQLDFLIYIQKIGTLLRLSALSYTNKRAQ